MLGLRWRCTIHGLTPRARAHGLICCHRWPSHSHVSLGPPIPPKRTVRLACPVVDHDRLVAIARRRALEAYLAPAHAIPLPHVAQRSVAMGRGAAIEQHDAGAFVEDHPMGVASARPLVRRFLPTVTVPGPGVVEEGLRQLRSRWRADAAEEHDLPAFAVVDQCRPAARGRAVGGEALPIIALQRPRIGRPRTRSVGRDPAEHQYSVPTVCHERVVIARRDVGDSPPAARIALPTISDHLPSAAVRLPRSASDDNPGATDIVRGGGIDPGHRPLVGHSLPARAAPAPHLVPVAGLRIPGPPTSTTRCSRES